MWRLVWMLVLGILLGTYIGKILTIAKLYFACSRDGMIIFFDEEANTIRFANGYVRRERDGENMEEDE